MGGQIGNVAYVFNRSASSWSQQQKLTDPTVGSSDSYGEAVAISGDTVLVGAKRGDEVAGSLGPGVVIAFTRSNTTWTRQAYLSASDGVDGDEFGVAVALQGDLAVVGAPMRDSNGITRGGSAYIFRRNGAVWSEETILEPPNPNFAEEFGMSVAIDGDRVIIGTDQATNAAYVFIHSQGNWSLEDTLTVTELPDEDISRFGRQVSIEGDYAVVGASRTDIGDGFDAGAAYLFERQGNSWVYERRLRETVPVDFGEFGYAVAIQDGLIVVGNAEPFSTVGGTTDASVYSVAPTTDTNGPLVSSILPASRSVEVGNTASVFAALINGGTNNLINCQILRKTGVNADFSYQATDPITNLPVGDPDPILDIPAGSVQNYVISLTPNSTVPAQDIEMHYFCDNGSPADSVIGLNSILFAGSSQPIPDVIALAATIDSDGIVHIPGSTGGGDSTGVFSVAVVNVGANGDIEVSADTGDNTLPLTITVCETNSGTGACLAPPDLTVDTTIAASATATFGVFVEASAQVPFDPANNRVFVRFRNLGQVRGATSVAAETP